MKFTLSQTFTFDAAHTLDRFICTEEERASSRRMHGHTYHAEISLGGMPLDDSGMVVDLASLRGMCEGMRSALDHRLLDEVEGLGAPTLENLAAFICRRVQHLCPRVTVRVWRADGGACTVES
jgi:6-pyruvoyltetrahydropterin/6-carboxytetrahydropterin synthase